MTHPDIEQTMRTGYPDNEYLEFEREGIVDYPTEDMFGSEIQGEDVYFVDEQRNVVLRENIRDYLTEIVGVLFYEAK